MASTIASVEDLKRYLDKTLEGDDELLQDILDGVSERVETYTGRSFHPDPAFDPVTGDDTQPPIDTTVYLPPHRGRYSFYMPRPLKLRVPDVREIDVVTPTAATITGFQPLGDPPWRWLQLFGLVYDIQEPFTQLPAVVITGRFGLAPAPADLKDAVLMMAARRWRERDAAYGDSVQMPEGGIVSYFRQFPPSVQSTLDSYAKKVTIT